MQRVLVYFGVFLLLWICVQMGHATSWMHVALVAISSPQDPCSEVPGLSAKQVSICRKHVELLPGLRQGVKSAARACQTNFQTERWNCSLTPQGDYLFGPIQNTETKEAAYIGAVTTAGVVHAVARACASGRLQGCSCDRKLHQSTNINYKWAHCSDDVKYAARFTKRFLKAAEVPRDFSELRLKIANHNNNVGRQVTQRGRVLRCKCHGVSGACAVRTCWKQLPGFHEIGGILKKKYEASVSLHDQSTRKRKMRTSIKRRPRALPVSADALVYTQPSPSFCWRNTTLGIHGTRGRLCSVKHVHTQTTTPRPVLPNPRGPEKRALRRMEEPERGDCELLCCGRGYNTIVKEVTTDCHCAFVYCCRVECDKCTVRKHIYTCK